MSRATLRRADHVASLYASSAGMSSPASASTECFAPGLALTNRARELNLHGCSPTGAESRARLSRGIETNTAASKTANGERLCSCATNSPANRADSVVAVCRPITSNHSVRTPVCDSRSATEGLYASPAIERRRRTDGVATGSRFEDEVLPFEPPAPPPEQMEIPA